MIELNIEEYVIFTFRSMLHCKNYKEVSKNAEHVPFSFSLWKHLDYIYSNTLNGSYTSSIVTTLNNRTYPGPGYFAGGVSASPMAIDIKNIINLRITKIMSIVYPFTIIEKSIYYGDRQLSSINDPYFKRKIQLWLEENDIYVV